LLHLSIITTLTFAFDRAISFTFLFIPAAIPLRHPKMDERVN
jgi:hypothetical protein